jgi:hypothetical protein
MIAFFTLNIKRIWISMESERIHTSLGHILNATAEYCPDCHQEVI